MRARRSARPFRIGLGAVRSTLVVTVISVIAAVMALYGPQPARADVRQTAPCAIADTDPAAPPIGVPAALARFDVEELWRFSRGEGQTVAVIDTGVAPHPRLHHLAGGGDLVGGSASEATGPGDPGLADCDAHGTLVAGIIGAAASPDDGFAGLAPDSRILSIRQSSAKFTDAGLSDSTADGEADEPISASGSGTISSLAQAIRMSTDQGATVINISEVACGAGVGSLRSGVLADAVAHAAAHDVVIVVAAGNTRGDGGSCRQNATLRDPLRPESRGWDRAYTDVAPAHYADQVLAVGSVDPDDGPSEFSLAGPWVRVAAPGTGIASLANTGDGGLANRVRTEHGVQSIEGTSFAAPFVSGLAALVRSRYPGLTAEQVVHRIASTAVPGAHRWEPTVGYGVIDPLAALTTPASALAALNSGDLGTVTPAGHSAPLDAAPARPSAPSTARTRALLGALAGALALAGIGLACVVADRARRGRT